MDYRCLRLMKHFVRTYLKPKESLKILEIGSRDCMRHENMLLKRYLTSKNWEYLGIDLVPGRNVDVVVDDPYQYPFEDNSFDIVLCSNVLEHVEDIYRLTKEIARITKKYVFITIPNHVPEHDYPTDCWRVYPAGMKFLLEKIAKLKILECDKRETDTYAIAEKI